MTTHSPDQPDEPGSASTPEQTIESLDSADQPAPSPEMPAPAPVIGENGEIIAVGGPNLPDGLPGAIPPGTGAALAARRDQEARPTEGPTDDDDSPGPQDGGMLDEAADDAVGQGFAELDEEALATGPMTYPMGRPAADPFRSDEEIEAEHEASERARARRDGALTDDADGEGSEDPAGAAPATGPEGTAASAAAQTIAVPPPLPGAPIRRRSRPRDPDEERESTAVRRRSLFPPTAPAQETAEDDSPITDGGRPAGSAEEAGTEDGATTAIASSATSALTGGSAPTPGAGTPALRGEEAGAPVGPESTGSHWTSKSSWTPSPSSSPLPPAPPLPSSTVAPVVSPEEAPDWSSVIAPEATDDEPGAVGAPTRSGRRAAASAASPAAAPTRRRRRAEAREQAPADEGAGVDDDVLLDGSTVVGKPASRFGAHWAGILIAVVLLPLSWFFGHTARHAFGTTAARSPEGAMSVNGVIVIALSALCLGVGLWMARRSSLGTILVGALTALAGIPGLVAPAATHRVLEQALGAAADRSSLGKDLLEFLWLDLSRGTFLLVGIVVLMVGIVSHSARRAGRREQEVIDRVRKAS
ncbi:hypothetical protein SAMN05216246_11439 [Actinomyces denticolens]|uniref:Uncharacterized protein n=2 Tax=Actinomyces denticolens TaxID=52767 RepID=A0ABY1IHV7_9ACTO|nr:hypothetical protein [Actinomyces denticolens]SHJ19402.1 hypothetical protein SAMN05216246_11439 [Actinomyces denticolens]